MLRPIVILLLLLLDGGEALSYFFLLLGVLIKSVLDLLLSFLDGGEPSVETSVLHLLFMISHGRWMMAHVVIMCFHGVVVEAMSREGRTSSLETTRNLLIRLLLIIIKVAILPLRAGALMPGTLQMMQVRLLPPSMSRLVHTGRSRLVPAYIPRMVHLARSCLIKSCVASEGRAF
jgi:hypothetical protein